MWHLNDDGAVPPLPPPLSPIQYESRESYKSRNAKGPAPLGLKEGCWVVQLNPIFADEFNGSVTPDAILKSWTVGYEGTMRVDRDCTGSLRVSGDLYVKRPTWSDQGSADFPPLEKPSEFPIFPVRSYSYYFTLQSMTPEGEARIATFRFNPDDSTWGPADILTLKRVELKDEEVPEPWRDQKELYQCWEIRNGRDTGVGRLHLGWFSERLREACIEIAQADGAPLPYSDRSELENAFKAFGWSVRVGNPQIVKGPLVWNESDLHSRMLKLRSESPSLDKAWTYHVLVVPRWREDEEYSFGKMYDVGALDSNLVPREGLVVATTAKFPVDRIFGRASGKELCKVPKAAFHNLMHELGHAMGLLHRFHGRGFMQGMPNIASQTRFGRFPNNLLFEFDAEDVRRLHHYPDIWVRPGGAPFEQGFSALPVPDADAITDVREQFELKVKPLCRKIPLGAPVKLQLRLTNVSDRELPGPDLLGLSDGSVAGRVIGPGGRSHTFSAAAPLDFVWTAPLAPGKSLYAGETLLRGPRGALFPEPGFYQIEVQAGWVGPGGIARVGGSCFVEITSPRGGRHRRAALDVLDAKELSILLIFRPRSDSELPGVREAIKVLRRALETPELRTSFASLEARRLAFVDLKKAARLIEEDCLMTTSDIEDLLDAAIASGKVMQKHSRVRRMIEICAAKARKAVWKNLEDDALVEKAEGLLL